jgi:hypothetical protein
MNVLKDTMKKFDGRKSEFRKDYVLGTSTHLIKIANSICMFDDLVSKLRATKCENVDNLEEVLNKLKQSKTSISDKTERILNKLINLEYFNKSLLKEMINSEVLDNSRLEDYMKSKVKTEKQGLDFATSIAMLDDYVEFLDTGKYSGITDNI